jgi:hypothetical protein
METTTELLTPSPHFLEIGENMPSFKLKLRRWLRHYHDALHAFLLVVQILGVFLIGWFANSIATQNYQIQKALYDFEPQISGFVSGFIQVTQYNPQAVASVDILINAPHSGNFTLYVNHFYPTSPYLDPDNLKLNRLSLINDVRDATYPQAYRFRGDITLSAMIYPKQNLTNIVSFPAGMLEFQIDYYDVPKNTRYTELFNETVRYEFAQ